MVLQYPGEYHWDAFLTHCWSPESQRSDTTTVIMTGAFRMRSARPFARGIMRFMLGPSSTKIFRNFQIVNVSAIVVFSVSNGEFRTFLDR